MRKAIVFPLSALLMSIVTFCVVFFQSMEDPILCSVICTAIVVYMLPMLYFALSGCLFNTPHSKERMDYWGFFGLIGVSVAFGIFIMVYQYINGLLSLPFCLKCISAAIYIAVLLYFVYKVLTYGFLGLGFKLWMVFGTLGFLSVLYFL